MINLKNRAARAITRSNYDTSASSLLNLLNWDDLKVPAKLKATIMFKTINGLIPEYLQNSFSTRGTRYNLRDSEAKLELPICRTQIMANVLFVMEQFSHQFAKIRLPRIF